MLPRRELAALYNKAANRIETAVPPLGGPLRALKSTLKQLSNVFPAQGAQEHVPPPNPEFFPNTLVHPHRMPTFEELSEVYPDDKIPPLDRQNVDESKLSWDQLHWRRNGFLVLNNFLPDGLIQDYMKLRERSGVGLGGFENIVWEETSPEIKALGCYAPLSDKISELFGEELAFNFSLTQFTSTNRAWHQDDYLGPDEVYGRYCAVWMALDDIHPDSGPFQFIPGSHRWEGVRGRLVREHLRPEVRGWIGLQGQGGHWAEIAESFTTPAYEAKIAREGLPRSTFHARKGDVLIWHGKLVHRGSIANIPGMRRPSLICHYYPLDIGSGANRQRRPTRYKGGGYYWPTKEPVPQYEAPNADEAFAGLSDNEWKQVLLRSVNEPVINGVKMPGFPDASTQVLFTSRKFEDSLNEAFTFYKLTKDACAKQGRPLRPTTRLLDLGVGWGRIIRTFMKDISGANLHGVDVDPNILKMCQELMPVGTYTRCENEALGVESQSFDVATAFSVFSHLSPKTHLALLNELHRALKPGGMAVFTTLSRSFLDECQSVMDNPQASDWHRDRAALIQRTFPDWKKARAEYNPETYFYLPAGGGFEWTGPEHYGWAMITLEYAKKHWTHLFDIVDYVDDSKLLNQAVFFLRKK
jgi:ubiquinone/menaquinone biosynthesis C-methylase UbiE